MSIDNIQKERTVPATSNDVSCINKRIQCYMWPASTVSLFNFHEQIYVRILMK